MRRAAPRRFRDPQAALEDFADEILVACPRCAGCARVLPRDPADPSVFAPRRLICPACGLARERPGGPVSFGAPRDCYFGLPLWLQAPCAGETLWAYNERHLALMEAAIGAMLRERRRAPVLGWRNRSAANRLPGWMKAASNRARVLKTIARLRARAAEGGEL
ncbi:MAG TPA: hypothetical protein VGE07_00320 [Herpetosiphonaceae bacterium]